MRMKQKRIDLGDIIKKQKLHFKNNKGLAEYYEKKYKEGGYKKGYVAYGIKISKVYQQQREEKSLMLLNPQKNEIILDAGCGDGKFAKRTANKCKRIYGIDISKEAIKKAKKNKPKNCFFLAESIETLPFSNSFFDKIVCIETLEHILNPKKAIKEFFRCLKPEGILVLSIPTIDQSSIAKIEKILKVRETFPVSEHLHEWDYGGIVRFLEENNFKVKDSIGIIFDFGTISPFSISKILPFRLARYVRMFRLKLETSMTKFPRNSFFAALKAEKQI